MHFVSIMDLLMIRVFVDEFSVDRLKVASFLLCKGQSEGLPPGSAILQDVCSVGHRGDCQEPPTTQQPSLLRSRLPVLPEALPVGRSRAEPQSGTFKHPCRLAVRLL